MVESNQPVCYTMKDLERLFPLGRNSLHRMVKQDGFPSIRIGRRILVPVEGLNQWLRDQSQLEMFESAK